MNISTDKEKEEVIERMWTSMAESQITLMEDSWRQVIGKNVKMNVLLESIMVGATNSERELKIALASALEVGYNLAKVEEFVVSSR